MLFCVSSTLRFGAPGARKRARRVREAVRGNGPVDETGTAPRIDFTTHLTAGTRRYIADGDWLTVYQLPPYAPDLNPVEGTWSVLRRTTTANRAFAGPDELTTAVRRGLRQLQYRPDILDGCLTGTGPPAPTSMTTSRIQGQ